MAETTYARWFFHEIRCGRYEVVQRILDEANSNGCLQDLLELVNEDGETGLFFATKLRRFAVAALLLENGASIEIIDSLGTSLPQLCVNLVKRGYVSAHGFLEILVSSGVNKDETNIDWKGTETALNYAVQNATVRRR